MLDVLVFFFFTAIFLALVAANVLVGLDLENCLNAKPYFHLSKTRLFVIKLLNRKRIIERISRKK
jgi:hypothetical protein